MRKFFRHHQKIIEAVKLTMLISGILVGLVRDFTKVDTNSIYELHEQFWSGGDDITSMNDVP
jgi:hypothetical protein